MISACRFICFSLLCMIFTHEELYAQDADSSKRPFYEYKGNYGKQVAAKKANFKKIFGYNLVDLGRNWSPVEIDLMHSAFEQLPPKFYKILGLKSLYRLDEMVSSVENVPVEGIPAATLPSF